MQFISKHILQIESILNIFENLIFRKKESTIQKDLQRTIDLLKSPLYFEVLSQLMLTSEPELIYKSTIIMNVIIVCLEDKQKVREFQNQILDYSTLLLRHVELCMGSTYAKQKHYSIIFIGNCLIDNAAASNLMMRLIPKPLFYLVEESLGDISKWSISQWEALFQHMNSDYNNATQQWNAESREELLVVLKKEIDNFYSNYRPLSEEQITAFINEMFRSPNFQISKEQEEKIIQLKWNYEEYEVAHKSLRKKFPVYKYYLEEIVDDKPGPELTVKTFKDPRRFWDELCTTLIASTEACDKMKLLKCMTLFYKAQWKIIKQTNILPFLLKHLRQSYDAGLEYLTLQLIYTLLENDPQKHNVRRFQDSGGLNIMRDFIQENLFDEDLNKVNYSEIEKDMGFQKKDQEGRGISKILSNAKMELQSKEKVEFLDHVVFLFNDPGINREALTPQLLKSNEIIICISILQKCVMATKSQTDESLLLIPKPLAKEVVFEEKTIDLFHRVLGLKDDVLLNIALDFIMTSYIDKFNFQEFIENKWVFSILLSKINRQNSTKISTFFEKALLSFSKSVSGDKRNLFEDLRTFNVNSPINDLALYSKNGNKILVENKPLFEIFDQFPGFCLLPSYFFHVLLTKGPHDFNTMLFSEKYESPFLLWNRQALESLKQLLGGMLEEYYHNGRKTPWETKTIHYSFADELTVGPILLKNWVFHSQYQSILPLSNIPDFLKTLTRMLTSLLDQIRQVNKDLLSKFRKFYLITLAMSCLFKTMTVYPYEEFLVIENFMRYYSYHERDEFQVFTVEERNVLDASIINCLKIIYNSIKVENSFEQMDFAKNHGLKLRVLKLFQRCVRNTMANELPVSFYQFKMNYILLKILKKMFRINGSLIVSFKDGVNVPKSTIDTSLKSDSDYDDNPYDIHIVLANLDIMLVKPFISMITNRETNKDAMSPGGKERRIIKTKKEITEKINSTAKSAFKRKKNVNDKDSFIEEVGSHSLPMTSDKMGSLQNVGPSFTVLGVKEKAASDSRSNRSLGVLDQPGSEQGPRTTGSPDGQEVSFKIDVQEATQFDFKVANKRMDRELILKMSGGMDLSTNSMIEVMINLRSQMVANIKHSGPSGRTSTFYHAVKKLMNSFFSLWVQVVTTLSENRKNTYLMIEASFPLVAFRISILSLQIESVLNTPQGIEIMSFCSKSLQIFKNLVYPVVELVFLLEKDSLYKRRLREELRQEILQAFADGSNVSWSSKTENVQIYFDGLINLFTLPIICFILNNTENEKTLAAFAKGIYDLKMFINKEILMEINAKIKTFVIDGLENNKMDDFTPLRTTEIQERSAHISICDIYIENYINNPQNLAEVNDVFLAGIDALYQYRKSEIYLKIVAEFLLQVIAINVVTTPISQKEIDTILRIFTSSQDPEVKGILLEFFKRRLKSKVDQIDEIFKSAPVAGIIYDSFFWIVMLNDQYLGDSTDLSILGRRPAMKQAIQRYVNFLCFVAKHTQPSYGQEIMLYLALTINDATIRTKLVKNLYKLSDLRPEFSEFLNIISETSPNAPDKPHTIVQFLSKKSIHHPLFNLNSQKLDGIRNSLFTFIKQGAEKINQMKNINVLRELKLSTQELLDAPASQPITFERINLPLFLLSNDNSFVFGTRFYSLVPKIENEFGSIVKKAEDFQTVISVLILLRTHDGLNLASENTIQVVDKFFEDDFKNDKYCQLLFFQYISVIECSEFMKDSRVADFYKEKFLGYLDVKPEAIGAADLIYFESLLLITLKRAAFLTWMASEDQVVSVLFKLREKGKLYKKIADSILNVALKYRLFSEQTINGIRVIDANTYSEIYKTNPDEFAEKIWKKKFIDNILEKNNLPYVLSKTWEEYEVLQFPIILKPDLENL